MRKTLTAKIVKVDEDQRIVYGWGSVIKDGGEDVVDHQGDVISERTLTDAVHQFMKDSRVGDVMHSGPSKFEVVESLVLTKAVQQMLGISLDKVGWLVAAKIHDNKTWARVKSGELKAFSIEGEAVREEIEEDQARVA